MDSTVQAIIAGFLIFAVAAIIFSAVGIMVCKRKRSTSSQNQAAQAPTRTTVLNPTTIAVEESASFDPSLQISMRDIIAATNNFSADFIAGDGKFGFVYKAELPNGLKLAVKKLDQNALQGFMEFRSELEILGNLRHRNVVRLLGYCISGADRILVYECFEKGNLDICLHDLFSERVRFPLCWKTRNKILRGVASGLAYMHDLEKPIIHRDIKAENILLDSDFEAHIADFGLARTVGAQNTHVSTRSVGSPGYVAPEYVEGYVVARVKGDVFSYGILMLEVATGKRPNFPVSMNEKTMSLMVWAREMAAQNREREMLDPNIWVWGSRRGLEESNIKEYFRIAFMCANPIPRERPTMNYVVELLARNST